MQTQVKKIIFKQRNEKTHITERRYVKKGWNSRVSDNANGEGEKGEREKNVTDTFDANYGFGYAIAPDRLLNR